MGKKITLPFYNAYRSGDWSHCTHCIVAFQQITRLGWNKTSFGDLETVYANQRE